MLYAFDILRFRYFGRQNIRMPKAGRLKIKPIVGLKNQGLLPGKIKISRQLAITTATIIAPIKQIIVTMGLFMSSSVDFLFSIWTTKLSTKFYRQFGDPDFSPFLPLFISFQSTILFLYLYYSKIKKYVKRH